MKPPDSKQWQDKCHNIKRYFKYSRGDVHSVRIDRGRSGIKCPVVRDWYILKKCCKEECDEPNEDQAAHDVDSDAKFGAHKDSFIEK